MPSKRKLVVIGNGMAGARTVEEILADHPRLTSEDIQASLPKDVRTQIVSDQSVFIKAAVENIKRHLIEATTVPFDNFSKSQSTTEMNRRLLGLE